MKKRLISLCGLMLAAAASAQSFDPSEVVPSDSSVRTGMLPSGITYYIKKNAKPENRADFHIYYKVGAIQEDSSQNGLAHFLEHMAFNGSKNFPDNSLIDYLASIGVRFGENLNAGTGQEMTTYMITNVPIQRSTVIDSALLVLHDWAGFINLDTADIDKERGVIIEEWRQGNSASRRIYEKQAPVIYNNSLYAKRNIIGNAEVIKNFKYQELRDFYHKWYRPDMQAFVIVGDFDLDTMEAKLRRTMADIQAPKQTPAKEVVTIPDNAEPLISITSDPELTSTSVQLIYRHNPIPDSYRKTYGAYKGAYIKSLIGNMLTQRLREIALKPDAPFLGAAGGYSSLVRSSDAFFIQGSARDGEALRTLEAIATELQRAKVSGFTASELERAKTDIQRSTQSHYENRNDMKHGQFADDYMSHFENETPYISPETDLAVTTKVLDNITLAEVNATINYWIRDLNRAVLISMPEKEGIKKPTTEQVLATLSAAAATSVAAYVDEVSSEPLITTQLKGSPIIKSHEGMFGSTIMELKNGIRVIVRPSTLKADEVILTGWQDGGQALITDSVDLYNLSMLPSFIGSSGLGNFSATEMRKKLTGKIASASPYIGGFSQGVSGGCSPKDLETMFQLLYMRYTNPRFDQNDWDVMMNQYRSALSNAVKNPQYILQDTLLQTLYGRNNPRVFMQVSDKVLNAVSLQQTEKLYRQFFSNAYGSTFIIAGNVNIDSLKPLVEKYLGSLPSKKAKFEAGKNIVVPRSGIVQNMFKSQLETPKATVYEIYTGELPYTPQNATTFEAIRYILEMRYTKAIREEKGGTYGVGVASSFSKLPLNRFSVQVNFVTDMSKLEELVPIVQEQIDSLARSGATAEEITKTKEFFTKRFNDGLINNGTWLGFIRIFYGREQLNVYDDYLGTVNALDSDMIRELAAKAFGQNNICTVVQMPKNETPAAADNSTEKNDE